MDNKKPTVIFSTEGYHGAISIFLLTNCFLYRNDPDCMEPKYIAGVRKAGNRSGQKARLRHKEAAV